MARRPASLVPGPQTLPVVDQVLDPSEDTVLDLLDHLLIERRIPPGASHRAGRSAPRRRSTVGPKGTGLRWNPETDDVQRSVAQLVLTIVEFLRKLMERQAIRRIGEKTLTRKEAEAVGLALMKLEETVQEIGKKFGLTAEDLNLDLGPLKLM